MEYSSSKRSLNIKEQNVLIGGSIALWLAYLLPDPAAMDSIPSIPEIFPEEKLSMLLRLINSAGLRKVDSGLKMLIELI